MAAAGNGKRRDGRLGGIFGGDGLSVDRQCDLCTGELSADWVLAYVDGDPATEGTREALLTLGNGYLAARGAAPESTADGLHYPGTYAAGVYNRLVSVVEGHGREDESVVNLPNWLVFTFRPAGGEWCTPYSVRRLHEHQALDLRTGVYRREIIVADRHERRTRLRQRRLVSMAAPHVAALETTVTPLNWSGGLEIRSALDGGVVNSNATMFAGLSSRHLTVVDNGGDGRETIWLVAETTASRLRVALVARNRVSFGASGRRLDWRTVTEPAAVGQELRLDVEADDDVRVDKVVAIFTSRDRAIFEPLVAAHREIADVGLFDTLMEGHAAAWDRLWGRLRLDGESPESWLPVAVQLFHLLQTLSPHTAELDVGVPARGLHGEGYHGHVFWDELFVFPFLNFRLPELTRALLRYRHQRLPQARRLAVAAGTKGALFPWQSGSDGRDESPDLARNPRTGRWVPDHTGNQHHVNLAVAYNVWRHWETTGELSFLASYGAELLIETARFWAGLATYDPTADRYDIRGVMGPDEFHDGYPDRPGQGVDNCAYINVMTTWVLARARDAHALLDQHHGAELWQHMHLTDDELSRWEHIGRRLRLSFLGNGIIEQFEGYGGLAELDWEAYRAHYGDIGVLGTILEAEGDSSNRYQASKQADVLMLLYLFSAEELTGLIQHLGYDFDPTSIPATVDYYLARTTHGSTLSRVAHAWVLARTNRRRSWSMLREGLNADLADLHGANTREGIHIGATAGTLDILQRCYTGLDVRHDVLWLNPLLPDELQRLDLSIRYRGQLLNLGIDHSQITIECLPSAAPPITVAIRETIHQLAPGTTTTVPRTDPEPRSGPSPHL